MERIPRLLEDWFGETRRDPGQIRARSGFWFGPDKARDARLGERYGELVRQAAAGELLAWQDEPEARLALILLLDQLPRNLYRGTPRAFATDPHAAALTLAGIATGMELSLSAVEQVFFYMPLQHAEDRATQRLSVQQFRGLVERNPDQQETFEWFLDYAEEHRDIIERFGRFPHRNAILGRESSDGELAYLEKDAPRFGQR